MDNLTHSLLGVALALGRPGRGLSKRLAIITAILAANLPDIDVLLFLFGGPTAFVFRHATLTHSLAALAVFPVVLAGIIALAAKAPFRAVWLLALVAMTGHLGLDALGSWGIAPLAPFAEVRIQAGWVYLTDLVVLTLLALPLWLPRFAGVAVDRGAALAIGLCVGYLGLLGGLHTLATWRAQDFAEEAGIQNAQIDVFASPFVPFAWNGLVTDPHFVRQIRLRLFGESTLESVRLRNLEHPAVRAVLKTDVGARYFEWAHAPVAEVQCVSNYVPSKKDTPSVRGRVVVRLRDLRFVDPWVELPSASLELDVDDRGPKKAMVAVGHRWVTPWEAAPEDATSTCTEAPISPRPAVAAPADS